MTDHPWIVLVEDDEPLQRQLAGAIERALPNVEVQQTPDADEALRLVRDGRSRLLITEAQSAYVDGLTLAAVARRNRPTLPLIFLGGAHLNGARARIAAMGGSHLVDKPPHLDRFVGLVSRVLDPPPGFRGEVATTDLMELVQLVVMTTPSGALHLSTPQGRGTVWLDRGSIVHAVGGGERGVPAFRRMLRWTGGDFKVDTEALAPERSITFTTTQLLLESARILDEEAGRPREDHKSGVRAVEHFERGLEAVQAKRYADALPEWERAVALEPENRMYQHNLARLRNVIEAGRERQLPGGGE
jgi:CheY-like chemotaxis protein